LTDATTAPRGAGSTGREEGLCGDECTDGVARCTSMAVSAKREATTRKSASATPRFDDSFEGRSID
jgi:hypothetical protein